MIDGFKKLMQDMEVETGRLMVEAIEHGAVKLTLTDDAAYLNDNPEVQKWLRECEAHITERLRKEQYNDRERNN
jgi:hypothetical protein